ncbi:MAG: phosphoribosylglycinamide formyltransferase [Bacteroidetes bacterium]|nr:phosphoribosylglycinamide formyltransferase [Bacteroidota bacterium]
MKKLALFASGTGSNAVKIAEYFSNSSEVEVGLLVCNKPDAPVIEKLSAKGIACEVITNQQASNGTFMVDLMTKHQIDFVVLAGYLRKIPDELVAAYPKAILNIHPALLPKYGGRGMYGAHVHQAVIAAGEKESGITIHYVNEHYDEGTIVFQAKTLIEIGETPDSLAAKIHQLEHAHFAETIAKCLLG